MLVFMKWAFFVVVIRSLLKKMNKKIETNNLKIEYLPIDQFKSPSYNPRRWNKKAKKQLKQLANR